jgi:hypothetical protein
MTSSEVLCSTTKTHPLPALAAAALVLICAHSTAKTGEVEPPTELVAISNVIAQVKEELRAAEDEVIGEPKLELKRVTLELNSVVQRKAGGEVKMQIIPIELTAGVEGSFTDQRTQRITLIVEPPKPVLFQEARDMHGLEIAETIVGIRRELQKGLSGRPVLLPISLSFEIAFGVKKSAGGDAGIDLVFLEIGPSAAYAAESVQTVRLEFTAPPP